jgi:hypothetical protein
MFRCSLIGSELGRGVEAAKGRWLTTDEIRSVMDDASATRLLDALRLGPPKIRSRGGTLLSED